MGLLKKKDKEPKKEKLDSEIDIIRKNKKKSKEINEIDEIRDNHKRNNKKLGIFEFYIELLFALISKGNLNNPKPEVVIPEGYFYYSTNKIFTKDKVKKVFFIDEFPGGVSQDFVKDLKFELKGLCEITVIERAEPYYFDRNSYAVKRRINIWKQRTDAYLEEESNRDSLEELFNGNKGEEYFDRNKRMIKSWQWVNDTEKDRDNFCRFFLTVELVASNILDLQKAEGIFKNYMENNGVKTGTIFIQTNEYYKAFSVAGRNENNMLKKRSKGMILSDRIISRFADTQAGLSGDTNGLYMGTDVITNLPITYDVKSGSDAVVFLLTASTGEGKSGASKTLLTHLEIENLCTIIVDYEGDEYTAIGQEHDAQFVSMSDGSSYYFDTTEIGDLTGNELIDEALKSEAISTTKLVFDVLTDYKNGMNHFEVSLFNDMILRVYASRGVTDDPETWKNSKGCSYEDLYRELTIMKDEEEYEHIRDNIEEFIIKLRLYFDGNIYSGIFKNRISINDLLGHKNIVFSFGMRGKTENTIDARSLALRQLFVGYITILICNYNKTVLNKLTYVAWEELQRYLNNEASGKIINDIVSGGRKRGMIVFLITNSPLQILDIAEDDTSELSAHTKAIKSNIKGYIVGRYPNEITEKIIKCVPQLQVCADEMRLINTDDSFKHCFLLNYKNEYNIVKFEIPVDLWDSPLYVTRKDQEDEE